MGDVLVLAGLAVYVPLLVLLVWVVVVFAAGIVDQLTTVPDVGPWPLDLRPSRDEIVALTSMTYWDEEYMPSLEEIKGQTPHDLELPPDSEFLPFTESPRCDECHLPMKAMYEPADPMARWHLYQELHPDQCDCCTCHRPPHPVGDECSCCDCHGCWSTGWSVEKELSTEQCFFCHEDR